METLESDIYQLRQNDKLWFEELLNVFSEAFDDPKHYDKKRPGADYTKRLLGSDSFIAIVALNNAEVVGGLTAYVLPKFEQERSEIYIYDLAVASNFRRMGIATALIKKVQKLGKHHGAWVVFVQADCGNDPAISLYTRLGVRENAIHFNIPVKIRG